MALKNMTLASLESTKLKARFEEAMNEVSFSLSHDRDVPGDRKICIEITFRPKKDYCITSFKCFSKLPPREEGAITVMSENGAIQIDTTSNDARQPGLPLAVEQPIVSMETLRERGAI